MVPNDPRGAGVGPEVSRGSAKEHLEPKGKGRKKGKV